MKIPACSILVLLILSILSGCQTGTVPGNEKQRITVSILPQRYFAERIAAEFVEVEVMVPSGASPATYEPSVSQLRALEESTLYLQIGHIGFEKGWMDRISDINPSMRIEDLSKGIELIGGEGKEKTVPHHEEATGHHHEEGTVPHHEEATGPHHEEGNGHNHSGADPHIWMSVRNAKEIAVNTHRALVELLPEKRETLDRNLGDFLDDCDSLDAAIRKGLSDIPGRTFMIYHPALAYYARDYGLEQLSLEHEGKEPSPAHMRRMADTGREHGIRILFVQKQYNRENARVLAGEIGARVVEIDPLDLQWPEQMKHITRALMETTP